MEHFSLLYSSDLNLLGTIWTVPLSCYDGLNVFIEGSQVIMSKQIVFLSLKIKFDLANSTDPGS